MKRKNIFGEFGEPKPRNAFSEKFTIPKISTADELKKFKLQETCPHTKYSVVCAFCSKVLGSEVTHTFDSHTGVTEILL